VDWLTRFTSLSGRLPNDSFQMAHFFSLHWALTNAYTYTRLQISLQTLEPWLGQWELFLGFQESPFPLGQLFCVCNRVWRLLLSFVLTLYSEQINKRTTINVAFNLADQNQQLESVQFGGMEWTSLKFWFWRLKAFYWPSLAKCKELIIEQSAHCLIHRLFRTFFSKK